MNPLTPEQRACQEIDKALDTAGWLVQDRNELNLSAGPGVAVREFKMADGHGFADYMLFVEAKAVGVLEAKPAGYPLTSVELQADKYATGLPDELNPPVDPLPFLYLSTGVETRFINGLDPDPKTRRISDVPHIHRPSTLAEWLHADTLNAWVTRLHGSGRPYTTGDDARPSSFRSRLHTLPPLERRFLFPESGRGGRQRRTVADAQPPPCPRADGNRLGQDDLRHHVRLPAHQVCRCAPSPLPRGPQQPR